MAFFDCEGDRLHYIVQGTGFPVMLLHSLGGSAAMWETTVAALAPHFKVVVFDARGHGRTTSNVRFTMARFAADAMALADHLGLDRLHLLGLSMGGRTVVRVAMAWPDRIVGLVVADTSPGDNSDTAGRLAALRKRINEIGDAAFAREYTKSQLMPGTSPAIVDAFAASVLRTLPDTYIDTFTSSQQEDLRGILDRVHAKTLVVVGENDVSAPPVAARAFVDGIPGAAFGVIPDANHLSNLDQPEQFNALVADFLLSLQAAG